MNVLRSKAVDRSVVRSSSEGHKLGQVCAERSLIAQNRPYKTEGGTMRGFHNSSFDPPTLVVLETAFDEAWLTLKSIGNTTVKPDELEFSWGTTAWPEDCPFLADAGDRKRS
jgi:hypothetical protein